MEKSDLITVALLINLVPAISPVCVVARNIKDTTEKSSIVIDKTYDIHLIAMLDSVSATSDQRQKISEIVMTHKLKITPLKEEYKRKSQEFLSCIMSGETSEVIMYEQDALNRLHGQIVGEYSMMQLEIRKVLNPSQWKSFQEYGRKQGWHTVSKQ